MATSSARTGRIATLLAGPLRAARQGARCGLDRPALAFGVALPCRHPRRGPKVRGKGTHCRVLCPLGSPLAALGRDDAVWESGDGGGAEEGIGGVTLLQARAAPFRVVGRQELRQPLNLNYVPAGKVLRNYSYCQAS